MQKLPDRTKEIIFFQTASEVERYARYKKGALRSPGEVIFVAMTPEARSRLKEKGFEAQSTIRYFTHDSHRRLLEKSESIMDWLKEESCFEDLDAADASSYRDSFALWMRCVVHYCLHAVEIAQNAAEMHRPQVIRASASGKKSVLSLFAEPREKYLGSIARKVALANNIEFRDISEGRPGFNASIVSRGACRIVSMFRFAVKDCKFRLWEKKLAIEKLFSRTKPVFLATRLYRMEKLAGRLKKELPERRYYFLKDSPLALFEIPDLYVKIFYGQYYRQIANQRKLFKNLVDSILENEALFSYRKVPFAGIISKKFTDNIKGYMLGLMLWSTRLKDFVTNAKAAAFISCGNRPDDAVLAGVCVKKGVPDVLISHGSHVEPKNRYERIEWGAHGTTLLRGAFSHLALQSTLCEKYLNVFPSSSHTLKTGPVAWGRSINLAKSKTLFGNMSKGRYNFDKTRIILHAGTPKTGNALRLHVYETPDEYIKGVCELAAAVEKIPEAVLIVKFRPRKGIGVNDLKSFLPFSQKVILSVKESFNDVLGMADLLVSFSSTTIEEALQNRIPVLLYGGSGRYQHVPAYEIKPGGPVKPQAVYHVREAEDLEYAMGNIFDLNIKGDKDARLFEPYIYPRHVRTSITDLLKAQPEKGSTA